MNLKQFCGFVLIFSSFTLNILSMEIDSNFNNESNNVSQESERNEHYKFLLMNAYLMAEMNKNNFFSMDENELKDIDLEITSSKDFAEKSILNMPEFLKNFLDNVDLSTLLIEEIYLGCNIILTQAAPLDVILQNYLEIIPYRQQHRWLKPNCKQSTFFTSFSKFFSCWKGEKTNVTVKDISEYGFDSLNFKIGFVRLCYSFYRNATVKLLSKPVSFVENKFYLKSISKLEAGLLQLVKSEFYGDNLLYKTKPEFALENIKFLFHLKNKHNIPISKTVISFAISICKNEQILNFLIDALKSDGGLDEVLNIKVNNIPSLFSYAAVKEPDFEGTSLMLSIKQFNSIAFRLLLNSGANLFIRTNGGKDCFGILETLSPKPTVDHSYISFSKSCSNPKNLDATLNNCLVRIAKEKVLFDEYEKIFNILIEYLKNSEQNELSKELLNTFAGHKNNY